MKSDKNRMGLDTPMTKKKINPDREPHTGSALFKKAFRASAEELDASERWAKHTGVSWNEFARAALRAHTAKAQLSELE